MNDKKFEACLAVLKQLLKEQICVISCLILSAVHLVISLNKIDRKANYLILILACYQLAAKLFENPMSTLRIKRFLSNAPPDGILHNNLKILGITNPETELYTKSTDRSLESYQMSIIVRLGFKFTKIEPHVEIK